MTSRGSDCFCKYRIQFLFQITRSCVCCKSCCAIEQLVSAVGDVTAKLGRDHRLYGAGFGEANHGDDEYCGKIRALE